MHASIRWLVASMGLAAWAAAHAATDEVEGLGLKAQLPSVQGRVRLGMSAGQSEPWLASGHASDARLAGASVLGDYYIGGRHAARDGSSSGFRATSGLYVGARANLWGQALAPAGSLALLSIERHSFSLAAPALPGEGDDTATVPYFGLGYSSHSIKWGLSFSADFGLMALNPGGALRLGRAFGGGQSVDDLLRDLRLSPVVQLGVSYSF
jgi:hypothetical protein